MTAQPTPNILLSPQSPAPCRRLRREGGARFILRPARVQGLGDARCCRSPIRMDQREFASRNCCGMHIG
eukprot:1831923-Rhodomonas_salina.3